MVQKNEEWEEALSQIKGEKVVVKLCQGGYDGKGVAIVDRSEILKGKFPFNGPCIVEEFISESREIAVLVCSNGIETLTWPCVEMHFDPTLHLVDLLFSPANLDKATENKACNIAVAAVKALNGKGVFAVELLLTSDGEILINEIAPRPHNSGHHTIEACITSQYEQLNRILLNLPLGNTDLVKPSVMINLIGPDNISGNYKITGLEDSMTEPGFYLHLYKKNETRPGRKMGHFTVIDDSILGAKNKALKIKNTLKISAI